MLELRDGSVKEQKKLQDTDGEKVSLKCYYLLLTVSKISRLVQQFLRPPRHFVSGECPGMRLVRMPTLVTLGFLKWSTIQGVIEVVPKSYFYQFVLLLRRGVCLTEALNCSGACTFSVFCGLLSGLTIVFVHSSEPIRNNKIMNPANQSWKPFKLLRLFLVGRQYFKRCFISRRCHLQLQLRDYFF